MPVYEITLERPNGDWPYTRRDLPSFQLAIAAALEYSMLQGNLPIISIQLLPHGAQVLS